MNKISKIDAINAMETVMSYIAKGNSDEHTKGTAERFINAWDNDWRQSTVGRTWAS